tara:strand:+ start:363 stop:719 length:357 start_codon:yes stop_codon:yes gene_type:complete
MENKINGKIIKLKKSNVVKKERKSKYSKWQLQISKWIKVEPLDTYQYFFKIQYYGAKLKEEDIIANSENVAFMVISVLNDIAIIMSYGAFSQKPKVYGSLTIVPKKTDKVEKTGVKKT